MIVGLFVTTAFLVVAAGLFLGAWLIIRRPSARGSSAPGSGLLSAGFDQIWHPQAARAREELDTEQRLVVEVAPPDPLERLREPLTPETPRENWHPEITPD